jgi:predicted ATP-dependent serine protease
VADLADLDYRAAVQQKNLRFALRGATLDRAQELRPIGEKLLTDPAEELPRWRSGLHSDFDAISGGFTGLTVLAGRGGSGKSMHALACALENALVPETVVFYLDAENALGEQQRRAVRWFGSSALFEAQMRSIAGLHFHWVELLPGMNWDQVMHWCAQRVSIEHSRVLVVLDSVNSIARLHRGKAFETSSLIYMACNAVVRETKGAVGFLALSELNKAGEISGREGEHHATLALQLEREEDRDGVIRMRMLKHRTGPLRPDLGLYEIDARHSRLVALRREEAQHVDA